jgi:DNA-binding TFAR19-related protein (PDSD5 family)
MSDDFLSSWRKQKLAMLRKQLSEKSSQEEDPSTKSVGARETILPLLAGRALEVLRTAEAQFPAATVKIEDELARLIREGRIREPISGEALYTLFRRLGLRVRLRTKIVYLEKGQEKSLFDKIKGK